MSERRVQGRCYCNGRGPECPETQLGYNLMPFFAGKTQEAPRKEIFYFDAGGNMNAIRYQNWKIHFTIMEGAINTAYRKSPSWPIVINLRADPFEVSWQSGMYTRWLADQMWTFVPAQAFTAQFLSSFKEFPPVQGSSMSVDTVLKELTSAGSRQ